jgi:uncharacterized membrane protein YgcG
MSGLKIALTCAIALLALPAWAAKIVPPAPQYYVFDDSHALTKQQTEALSTLLIEHDQATGEQVIFAVFEGLEGEDPQEFARALFERWNVGQGVEDNGTLLAVFLKEHRALIEKGRGLDSVLTPAQNDTLIKTFLTPELKAGNTYRALGLSGLELLRLLQSPLIDSGRAEEILKIGGFKGLYRPIPVGARSWYLWVLLGVLFFAIEAHFSSAGWFRPNPWRQILEAIRQLRHPNGTVKLGGSDGHW